MKSIRVIKALFRAFMFNPTNEELPFTRSDYPATGFSKRYLYFVSENRFAERYYRSQNVTCLSVMIVTLLLFSSVV